MFKLTMQMQNLKTLTNFLGLQNWPFPLSEIGKMQTQDFTVLSTAQFCPYFQSIFLKYHISKARFTYVTGLPVLSSCPEIFVTFQDFPSLLCLILKHKCLCTSWQIWSKTRKKSLNRGSASLATNLRQCLRSELTLGISLVSVQVKDETYS